MKRAIVVGASSGIGLEVARLLRQQGWMVGVAARRVELLTDFEHSAQIDVTSPDAGEQLLEGETVALKLSADIEKAAISAPNNEPEDDGWF